jgi:hypothetical protein
MTFNNENGLFVLWNPSIPKDISLPKSNLGKLHQTFGFDYEPMTDDYKLVRLMNIDDCHFKTTTTFKMVPSVR